MLTLYDFGNSVCCQKVRITMHAKGLTWESVRVDLFKAEQYEPKYLKLNSKGVVPTLVKDRPRVKGWWALAHEWPSFKSGLHDLISEAEFSEMRTHGPKIANDVAGIIAEVRRNTPAAVN
jgi:hypothetical protein